jgi:hypothetical protein
MVKLTTTLISRKFFSTNKISGLPNELRFKGIQSSLRGINISTFLNAWKPIPPYDLKEILTFMNTIIENATLNTHVKRRNYCANYRIISKVLYDITSSPIQFISSLFLICQLELLLESWGIFMENDNLHITLKSKYSIYNYEIETVLKIITLAGLGDKYFDPLDDNFTFNSNIHIFKVNSFIKGDSDSF